MREGKVVTENDTKGYKEVNLSETVLVDKTKQIL